VDSLLNLSRLIEQLTTFGIIYDPLMAGLTLGEQSA